MVEKEIRFRKLVEENEARIRRICCYYAPTSEDRSDMYQEVLVNIWKSLDGFRGESSPGTWIYRIAVNTSLSYSGKHYNRMKLNVDVDPVFLQNAFSSDDEYLIEEENRQMLQSELNQLSFIDKAIMGLVLEGLSTKQISDIIGITESNVRVKIHRIKTEIRERIATKNDVKNQKQIKANGYV